MHVSQVIHTIQAQHLIPPLSTVLVAVSGGMDSMVLLHVLNQAKTALNIHLHVATLDHGLRGAASAADAEFVRQTAESWRLPVTVGKAHLDPALPGIEARARQARYAFLTQTAVHIGARHIALAHHADDQAETVLMHLIRGGGIHGLGGMQYSSEISESVGARYILPLQTQPLYLIRPLLNVTRAEIAAYCAEHAIPYRHDGTNDEPNTLRNRLRLQTLPHLRDLNPQISTALTRLAHIATAEDEFLMTEVKRLTEAHTINTDGRINLSLEIFRGLHLALKRRWLHHLLMMYAHGEDPNRYEYGYDSVESAIRLMENPQTQVGAVAEFPNGWRLRKDYQYLVLEHAHTPPLILSLDGFWLPAEADLEVKLEGETLTPFGWRLHLSWLGWQNTPSAELPPSAPNEAYLLIPPDAHVRLRTRRAGDRLAPSGLKGHERKLKDWLIDRKIPRIVRDHLPLLTVNGMIAGVLTNSLWYVTNPFTLRYNTVALQPICRIVTVAKI